MDLFDAPFHCGFPLKWETFDKSDVLYAWSKCDIVVRCEMPWPWIWSSLYKFLWTDRYRLCPEEHPGYANCYKPSAQVKKTQTVVKGYYTSKELLKSGVHLFLCLFSTA